MTDYRQRSLDLIAFGQRLTGAKVYLRKDWNVYYFDLLGKQFGIMSVIPDEHALLTLKGLPEKNEILREQYTDVTPGYHTNKVHWNSIKLGTSQLSTAELEKMILASYSLVYQKLSKKDQLSLTNSMKESDF
ncbi:MmcQ/YjbR family DNA-binding protein [Vagococcus entomophilus]|uniref:MmcQ/YjbR family DNA-binding protein n=1 Tax=Vagococcus entomophilus TaxID=1160095 RepID=A0A430AKN9_9ENTE|nr:MmcQ/YjbR family DNA-binding protein [Vagococcus entomophilus]RSU08646.1 hypothetical protein CBF30_05310 [Vagococcus entomophilus]